MSINSIDFEYFYFGYRLIVVIDFLVARLLYNMKCPSLCNMYVFMSETFWRNMIYSATIQDRQLKFLVKIPLTN